MEGQLSLNLQQSGCLQQETVFSSHSLVKDREISLCPTLDLFATVNYDSSVHVFRFNGQFAFGKKRQSGPRVESICWKFDGKLIYFENILSPVH